MTDIRLTADILRLALNPADKILLAYLCQQAALREGTCPDTNAELAQAVNVHPQTISTQLHRLEAAHQLVIDIEPAQGNQRSLRPGQTLINTYRQLTQTPLSGPISTFGHSAQSPLSPAIQVAHPPTDTGKSPTLEPAATLRPVRLCPLTGVDITHQRADQRLANIATLETLLEEDSPRFYELAARWLTPQQAGEPTGLRAHALADAIRAYDRRHPSPPTELRYCPLTGIDVSRQSIKFPLATAATIQQLYLTDYDRFAQVMKRSGLGSLLNRPRQTQCRALKAYVDQQAAEGSPGPTS